MSWSVRITARATALDYGYESPWYLYAGDDGDVAVLLLHSDLFDSQLDEEDPLDLIWRAGFLPASNSVERTMVVDAASGGDLDQVRQTTILIANQMADGTLMTEFVAANGIRLHGARIEVFSGVPANAVMPAPYWAGHISQARPDGLDISLTCEPDGDDAPIGTLLGDSVIRPLVIGSATNVKLDILEDATTYPNLTKIGYSTWDPPQPVFPSLRSCAAEFLYLDVASRRLYMFINAKTAVTDDEYLEYFPDGVVPDGNWTLEIVSGSGKNGVRAVESGSDVYIWRGTGTDPHLTLPGFKQLPSGTTYSIPSPYETGYISFLLAPFFATFDAWGTMSAFALVGNPGLAIGGQEDETPIADVSYLRLARRDLYLVKPEHASSILFKFRSNDQMGAYNSFGVIDEGDRYLVDFRRHPSSQAHLFRRLDLSSHLDFSSLQNGSDTMVGDIHTVFAETPTSVTFGTDQHGLYIGIRKSGPDGSELDAHLRGGKRLWLSIDADYEGYLYARVSIFGRQKSTYSAFDRVDVFPMRLADVGKVFAPLAGGCKLLFDWEAGYTTTIAISPSGGMYVDIPSELEVVQYIQIFLGVTDTEPSAIGIPSGPMQDESLWWGDTSDKLYDLVINSMSMHVEIETAIDSVWGDIVGPSYLTCPGGIDRVIDEITVNSFAIERNAYDYPLSSGIVQSAPIDDHVHAIEALLRMRGDHGEQIDTESYETAYWDMMCKTRTTLTPEAVALRPKCAIAINKVSQVGDVLSQLCRDGGLIGGRNAANQRTLKAFLARTRIAEQDYSLKDSYVDGSPSDFLEDDLTPGLTSINSVVTSPLIRYAMEAGKASRYIQVLHPDAPTYDASYCIGFESPTDAQAAWEICHDGWLRTGIVLARELTMASVSAYSTLIKLLMPQRGCGQLEWMSRQKRTLTYPIADTHAAALAPNGSRMFVTHWLRAPGGVRGTLVSSTSRRATGQASQTIILDPDA